jgi:hypothetical protein
MTKHGRTTSVGDTDDGLQPFCARY